MFSFKLEDLLCIIWSIEMSVKVVLMVDEKD
jgi:hypothetical protein